MKRYKEKEKDIIFTHKNYGKTPEYLKQFKLEEIKRKEYEKILEEESHYPPGTKLLSENERINTLNNLIETKKGIINILEKMPITKRSQSIQDKKEELEKKLEQIEKENMELKNKDNNKEHQQTNSNLEKIIEDIIKEKENMINEHKIKINNHENKWKSLEEE